MSLREVSTMLGFARAAGASTKRLVSFPTLYEVWVLHDAVNAPGVQREVKRMTRSMAMSPG